MQVVELREEVGLSTPLRKYFPHATTRKYQADIGNTIYRCLRDGATNLLLEGPTGLGKTAPVWAAVKRFADENRLRILWLSRTVSQVTNIARETGCLPVYGRKVLCIHETVSMVEQRRFNSACRATRIAQRCPYYPGKPKAILLTTVGELRKQGTTALTCPYEIQLASIQSTGAIAATHRQLRVIGWLFAKWRTSRQHTILILDEAQHILKNILEMSRDSVSLTTIKKAAKEAARYGFRDIAGRLAEAFERYSDILTADGETEVDDLLPAVDDLTSVGDEVQDLKLKENLVPASHVLSVADFKLALAGNRPFLVKQGGRMWLEAPADPKTELERIYEGWKATVTMSATLDTALMEKLTGKPATLLRAGWPYDEQNLTAFIVTGLTTRYPERDEELYEDVAWLCRQMHGKTLIFVPSYEILQKVEKIGNMLYERPGISQEEAEELARKFNELDNGILMTVYGGRLSEGIDLPANAVVLLGVPFAKPTPKSKKLLKTLEQALGDEESAWVHGIALPALYSAVQAAGRAVRGPDDRALVLMVDDRYQWLAKFLPRWFKERLSDRTVKLSDVPILLERWQ